MEPPAKRLRILQSVEVDETNPEYIAAREKEKARLKSRFESIFAKFEAMPEAMSDEIDMRTGEIVVDRGNLRKMDREYRRRQGRSQNLLDDLMADKVADELEDGSDDDEGEEEDCRDELAPSKSPEPMNRKQDAPQEHAPAAPQSNQIDIPPPNAPARAALQPSPQLVLAHPPDSAANLMQLVPFPQTPDGQQARNAFVAELTQTINQAVQRAVPDILSNLLANVSALQLPSTNTLPISAPPTTTEPKAMPTAAPKEPSPPIPEALHQPGSASSAPAPTPVRRSKRMSSLSRSALKGRDQRKRIQKTAPTSPTTDGSSNILDQAESQDVREPVEAPHTKQSPIENTDHKSRRRGPPLNYAFSEEDTTYIIEQRKVHERPWAAIRDSRSKWKNWPTQAFSRHWSVLLTNRTPPEKSTTKPAKLQEIRIPNQPRRMEGRLKFPSVEKLASPAPSHHLPTPNSLEQHEAEDLYKEMRDALAEDVEDAIATGAHFDNYERDLLSLAGADEPVEATSMDLDDTLYCPERDELILTSIEKDPLDVEGAQEKHIVMLPDIEAITAPVLRPEASFKPHPALENPSSAKQSKRKRRPINFQLDSESEIDVAVTTQTPAQLSRSAKSGKHTAKPASSPPPNPITQNDELLAPDTPFIKRESITPPPNLLLSTPATAFRTPMSAPQRKTLQTPDATSGSASKHARSAFLKKVKQSWAMSGRKATPGPKGVVKRRSFQVTPKQRIWDVENSDDELAM